MIKKIKISDDDEKNALTCVYLRDNNLVSMDFSGVVVNKPWGYEYLMFKNHEISIWLLYFSMTLSVPSVEPPSITIY